MKRYGTGSGSDRVVLWKARSTPRPVATAPGIVPAPFRPLHILAPRSYSVRMGVIINGSLWTF
jgi:hypothetical protein